MIMKNGLILSIGVWTVFGRLGHALVSVGWQQTQRTTTLVADLSKDVESIARELQDMEDARNTKKKNKHKGKELPVDDHRVEGFSTYHESLVHKLRQKLYEKDKMLHQALDDLETAIMNSATAIELAEISESSYRKEHQLYQEEHESVRRLLWQATKLMGRRIKNIFLYIVRFGSKQKSAKKQ